MPPAALIAVGIGAAAAGGTTGAVARLGKSDYKPKNFGETDLYNPNAGQYGGRAGLAEENANRQKNRGAAFDQHQADWDAASAGAFNESAVHRQQGAGSAQGVGRAAGLMEQRALGRNLISKQVADRARRGLAGEMASQAASARGPAALALAQQNATAAGAQGMADLGAQEMIASSQEQLAAEGAMANAYGQQGQLYGNLSGAATGAQNAANQNVATYGQNAAQAGAQEHEINKAQNEAMQRQQETLARSHDANTNTQSGNDRANSNMDWEYAKMMVGGASSAGSAGVSAGSGGKSDPLAKFGVAPISGGESDAFNNMFGSHHSDPKAKEGVTTMSGKNGYPNDNTHRAFQYTLDGQLADKAAEKKNTMKSYRRDTASDQKRVAQRYDDQKAARLKKEAQRMMAELGVQSEAAMAAGPAVGGRRRVSDEEAGRLAGEGETMRSQMRAQMDAGPAVGGRPRISDAEAARLMGEGESMRSQMSAQLGEGPSAGRSTSLAPGEQRALNSIDDLLVQDKARLDAGMASGTRSALERQPSWLDEYMAQDKRIASSGGTSDPAAKQAAYQLGLMRGGQDPAFEGQRRAEIDQEMTRSGYAEMSEAELRERELEDAADLRGLREKGRAATRREEPPAPSSEAGPEPDELDRFDSVMSKVSPLWMAGKFAGKKLAGKDGGTSDPRAKKLGGVHSNEIADALDKVPAVSYKYKSPEHEPDAQRPGERQVGFLTSDLKKTPVGRTVVEEGEDGLERYNGHRMQGFTYAGVQNVHERLRELEARLASAKGGSRKAG